jgi:hypothetical protein
VHPPQLSVYANGEVIPDYLMMDLRGLRVGSKVMASDVELNEGLRLVRVARPSRSGVAVLRRRYWRWRA